MIICILCVLIKIETILIFVIPLVTNFITKFYYLHIFLNRSLVSFLFSEF